MPDTVRMPAAKQHRSIAVRQVDAFTETPLTGNPAGVVVDAAGLTDQQMQLIAREIGASETAFILPPTVPRADLRVRWFTPLSEVPLCGHATIAAFHTLAEEGLQGMGRTGRFEFLLETRSGQLPVTVDRTAAGTDIQLGLRMPEFVRAGQHKLDVMRILNIALDDFENRLPIVMTDYLYVPIRRLHSMFSMRPNLFAMAQFLTNRKLEGLCVFTTETVDRRSAVHVRFFAPTVGINEDPVTGSATGPVGVYLVQHGLVAAEGDTVSLIAEQGDVIGRRGRVAVQVGLKNGEAASVRIGGRAVTVFSGEMRIP
jgi:PhzF family phenazine biosynthesis protein